MSYRDGYIIKEPYNIGGRATDVATIASSIYCTVREAFPINQVPTKYIDAINHLKKLLEVADEELQRVIELLKEDGS